MAKWEYRVCAVRGGEAGQVEEQLNAALKKFSDDGWRFVETFYAQNSLPVLLFRKPGKSTGKSSSTSFTLTT
jgi:hypothetical protein